MNKMWDSHIMEYCWIIKRNEVLINATIRVYLEDIVLKEASHKRPHIV